MSLRWSVGLIESDHVNDVIVMYFSALNMRSDWFFPVLLMIDDSLQ